MLIGRHHYRYAYFAGRMLSFGLAGMAAGEAGAVAQGALQEWHISEALTFILGGMMLAVALLNWKEWSLPKIPLPLFLRKINHTLSCLLLQDKAEAVFAFGLLTVALPCGQSLIVFSACALTGDAWVGLANGLAFALLTSPSLWIAMHALHWFQSAKQHYRQWISAASLFAGIMAICRGMADIGWIPHFSIGPSAAWHIMLY
jgi:sulfite exporter TauE/SafE